MRVQRRLSVVLMGCLTVTAVAMAGRPAVVEAAPIPGSGDSATGADSLDPQAVGELRDALAQLRPLAAADAVSLRDKATGDVGAGVIPWHSADAPAWDQAVAFGLPNGRTLVATPSTATGDSLGVLYDANGAVSRHVESRIVTRPDESAATTVWIDDAAPVERTLTADQVHNAAASAKEVFLGPDCAMVLAEVPLLAVGTILMLLTLPALLVPGVNIAVGLVWVGVIVNWIAVPVVCLWPM
ncbi:hypothetical protein ABZ942_26570 [Nocardia sp. NPDC046473]|uniref:hypothetical protein n=1 Tax=Nocardia sp. NPDC046473 TaxID=3155733 RepID=UPI0033F091FA